MRIKRPSPSMGVAITALVMACTGSAVAAVNFAKNAGAVDGKSAVKSSSKVTNAAGKLVATAEGGARPGKFPSKFLADTAKSTNFAIGLPVEDNAGGAPVDLGLTAIGKLTAACNDQAEAEGTENPSIVLTLSNPSAAVIGFSRDTGSGSATVGTLAPNTVHQVTINGSNTFRIRAQQNTTQVVFDGFVRQDGAGTLVGSCAVAGTTELVVP